MNRRGFLSGIIALAAAPAIVRAGSLMPVKVMPEEWCDFTTANMTVKAYDRYAFGYRERGNWFLITDLNTLTVEERAISDRIVQQNRDARERMAADILNRQFDVLALFGSQGV
jgi:hypothetical protein